MDKEEARFVLRCFRPDGADAGDKDFAEALQMAASDRELGEWLASERAQDADFSAALGRLALPDGLREEILAGLAAEQGETIEMDSYDGRMIGALAQIAPPKNLRGEILAAMERSTPSAIQSKPKRSWWNFGVPAAAAAGIAMAFIMTRPDATPPTGSGTVTDVFPQGQAVPISHVEAEAISALSAPGFSLDLRDPNHQVLFEYIRKEGRACPEGAMPRGLEGVDGIGCRKLDVDGKRGAIVCFRKDSSQVVHLVVFRKADVQCPGVPENAGPQISEQAGWSVARWQDSGRVFLLLGHESPEDLGELF